MNATRRNLVLSLAVLGMAGILANDAQAQRGGFRGLGGNVSQVQLTTLAEVQSNLMLTADQKAKVNEIAEELTAKRRDMFQGGGGGGDFAARREQLNELNAEFGEKLKGVLDEKQQGRLNELFVQVNGAGALTDKDVAQALALTADQIKQVADVLEESRQAQRDAFQDQASREERRAAREKMTAERDAKLLALLTDEQKQSFESMKGEKLEIDTSQLRGGRGGGRGN